ncbi:MAG: TonB-dependent receptor plug domain-containing protein [Thermodesulfobacteriota bacterium]|nr:TonB-dependent receptor plug domain-containing protein [Thermodesulfobacteriota bacterium]
MKRLRAMLCSVIIAVVTPLPCAFALGEDGLEMLLFQEIPDVFTASKTDQSVERATAVVSVITEDDIQRWGTRTLYEVLKRVPGFFPSSQATWTLSGTRGLTSDGNDHVLLLIDGHVQNSIVGQGYQQQDMLPVLHKVKKIEIIRGPGSVLWGSSAVMGIINIITKDGPEHPGNKTSVTYGDGDDMFSVNHLASLGREDSYASGIVSLTYWQSGGYDRPDQAGTGAAWSSGDAGLVKANVEFPWGKVADWPPIDRHREGWEIYAKVKVDDVHEVLGRVAQSRVVYPWDTWLDNPGSDLTMRKAYLSYTHHRVLHDRIDLDFTTYGDLLIQNRFPYYKELFESGGGENRGQMQDQSNEELAFGAELTGSIAVTKDNHLTLGVKAVRTRVGPNRDSRFDIAANTPTSVDYPYVGVESGYDNTLAVYFEDIWNFNQDRTTLFFGGRLESNDFREEKTVFLPRLGVIQSLGQNLTAKYVYNSGYLRPNAVYSKTSGIIVDATRGPNQDILLVDESEKIQNHEVQLYWKKGKNHLAANVFYMLVDNYISFDANNLPQGYKNLGDAASYGLEVEAQYVIRDGMSLYGNYSYAKADLDDNHHQGALTNGNNETLNYPRHIYNVGLDWMMNDFSTLNVNLNGWQDMKIVKPLNPEGTGGAFGELDGEMYVDVNLRTTRILGTPFDLTILCMNVFNNTDAVGMIVNNGVWYPRGRNLGASLTYTW